MSTKKGHFRQCVCVCVLFFRLLSSENLPVILAQLGTTSRECRCVPSYAIRHVQMEPSLDFIALFHPAQDDDGRKQSSGTKGSKSLSNLTPTPTPLIGRDYTTLLSACASCFPATRIHLGDRNRSSGKHRRYIWSLDWRAVTLHRLM